MIYDVTTPYKYSPFNSIFTLAKCRVWITVYSLTSLTPLTSLTVPTVLTVLTSLTPITSLKESPIGSTAKEEGRHHTSSLTSLTILTSLTCKQLLILTLIIIWEPHHC